jgi:hypothetical protein
MTPTPRRVSGSSLRRLRLPTNAREPSRMMARTWSRLPGYFSKGTFRLASAFPMIFTSTSVSPW